MTTSEGLGLKQKFAGGASLIFASLSTFIVVFFPLAQERQMKEALAEKAQALGQMAAQSVSAGLLFEDVTAVQSSLEGIWQSADVIFVAVRNQAADPFYTMRRSERDQAPAADDLFAQLGLEGAGQTLADAPGEEEETDRAVEEEAGVEIEATAAASEAELQLGEDDQSLSLEIEEAWLTAVPIQAEGGERIGSLTVALSKADLASDVASSRRTALIVGVVTLVLGFGVFWFMASRIVLPLNAAVRAARQVADGDLDSDVEIMSTGEPRELLVAMKTMLTNMRRVIGGMVQSSSEVSSIALQLSESSSKILHGAEQQSSASDQTSSLMQRMVGSIRRVSSNAEQLSADVSEVAASIEETSTAIQSIADNAEQLSTAVAETSSTVGNMDQLIEGVARNARHAGRASKEAVAEAEEGGRAVREAAASMRNITQSIDEILAVTRRLSVSSGQITKMVDVINDLAAQTNLLSLNAAIQAAHAGEHGRGFAVVAEEVRRLAESSASSAREISEVIQGVQTDTDGALKASEQGAELAREGLELAGAAGEALDRIVDAISTASALMVDIEENTGNQVQASEGMVQNFRLMTGMTEEIKRATQEQGAGAQRTTQAIGSINAKTEVVSRATKEQSGGAEEVGGAMGEIAKISTEHLSAASHIAGVTDELSRQADALRVLSESFRVENEGNGRRRAEEGLETEPIGQP